MKKIETVGGKVKMLLEWDKQGIAKVGGMLGRKTSALPDSESSHLGNEPDHLNPYLVSDLIHPGMYLKVEVL